MLLTLPSVPDQYDLWADSAASHYPCPADLLEAEHGAPRLERTARIFRHAARTAALMLLCRAAAVGYGLPRGVKSADDQSAVRWAVAVTAGIPVPPVSIIHQSALQGIPQTWRLGLAAGFLIALCFLGIRSERLAMPHKLCMTEADRRARKNARRRAWRAARSAA